MRIPVPAASQLPHHSGRERPGAPHLVRPLPRTPLDISPIFSLPLGTPGWRGAERQGGGRGRERRLSSRQDPCDLHRGGEEVGVWAQLDQTFPIPWGFVPEPLPRQERGGGRKGKRHLPWHLAPGAWRCSWLPSSDLSVTPWPWSPGIT